jgi:sulfur transfer complex TusBCD TusB component (DsrH family)
MERRKFRHSRHSQPPYPGDLLIQSSIQCATVMLETIAEHANRHTRWLLVLINNTVLAAMRGNISAHMVSRIPIDRYITWPD